MKWILIAFSALIWTIFGCQQAPSTNDKPQPPPIQDKPLPPAVRVSSKISVMAYNLENLFDDVSDAGERPTPIETLEKKLKQVASGILQIDGAGPDILFVSEVENLRVLKMLNDKYLQAGKYKTVTLLESNDERGIDVGLISRFPMAAEPVLHRMPFSDINPTRGILEVTLKLPDQRTLKAFAVHLPSQANPPEQRREAAELLRNLMRTAKSDFAIGAGDFNITTKEENEQKIFSELLKEFEISHIKGCKACKGTYHYRGRWDFLDVILVRESNTLEEASVRTPAQAQTQITADGIPHRFDSNTGAGISDHLPIFGILKIK